VTGSCKYTQQYSVLRTCQYDVIVAGLFSRYVHKIFVTKIYCPKKVNEKERKLLRKEKHYCLYQYY